MTVLVVCFGEGKGSWVPALRVVKELPWEHVFVITHDFFKDKIVLDVPHSKLVLDENADVLVLIKQIRAVIAGKVFGDVAINLLSGSGKVHMAVISALLQEGAGIRFMTVSENQVKEV